jgi:hypothetical protein
VIASFPPSRSYNDFCDAAPLPAVPDPVGDPVADADRADDEDDEAEADDPDVIPPAAIFPDADLVSPAACES